MEQSRYAKYIRYCIRGEQKIRITSHLKTKEGIPIRATGIRENSNKHPNEDGNFLVQKSIIVHKYIC